MKSVKREIHIKNCFICICNKFSTGKLYLPQVLITLRLTDNEYQKKIVIYKGSLKQVSANN